MKVGSIDHWAVQRLNARVLDLANHLDYIGNEVQEVYESLEGQEVESFTQFLGDIERNIEIALDDLQYIRERFATALLIQTDEDPE
jgi:hypothetical protein